MASTEKDDYSDVTLRPLELSDADEFVEFYTDENVRKFEPIPDDIVDTESATKHLSEVIIPHPWQRAICLKGKPVGMILMRRYDACRAEIGYKLGSKFWGKGIAAKAVKLAVKSVFLKRSRLQRVEGVVDVENIASQKVLLKAGFSKEGVLRKYRIVKGRARDMVMFSLLKTDLINITN